MQNLYGVVGDPIAQSWSPIIHTQLFQMQGFEGSAYIALHITPRQLEGAVDILRGNFRGFNITIPHKRAVMDLVDELTPAAERYGAVNTVKCEAGKLIGHNTDGAGFTAGLQLLGWELAGSAVLLLGAGGAARVAAYELAEMGCSLTIGSRTLSTAEGLAEEITSRFPHLEIAALPWVNLSQGTYDVVVNATPVGMGAPQGERPINLEDLKGVTCVYDLIYNPPQTRLLRQGQELGLKVLNGLPMLVFQAAAAQEFWLGRPVPEEAIWQVLASLQELKGNG
ncbi:MAG TPA: shikimate dehydrogenase [Firmicutes bacterium]|nr:MAG: hypothetical protein AA931_09435 [Peptococcaceae bacterium 1109]HHT73659.1 shikimate dehydrogenase [Bacillota bacterium]